MTNVILNNVNVIIIESNYSNFTFRLQAFSSFTFFMNISCIEISLENTTMSRFDRFERNFSDFVTKYGNNVEVTLGNVEE